MNIVQIDDKWIKSFVDIVIEQCSLCKDVVMSSITPNPSINLAGFGGIEQLNVSFVVSEGDDEVISYIRNEIFTRGGSPILEHKTRSLGIDIQIGRYGVSIQRSLVSSRYIGIIDTYANDVVINIDFIYNTQLQLGQK